MVSCEVVILGSERSGTNLLRTLLRRSLSLSGPAPAHLEKVLARSQSFLDGSVSSLGETWLSERLALFLNHPKTSWGVRSNEIAEALKDFCAEIASSLDVARAVHLGKARADGLRGYVTKPTGISSQLVDYVSLSENLRFVWILRDPVAVMDSWYRLPPRPLNLAFLIQRWTEEQSNFRDFSAKFPEKTILVSYEDLLESPELEMSRIADFLKLPYSGIPEPSQDDLDESTRIPHWSNIRKPVSKDLFAGRRGGLRNIERWAVLQLTSSVMVRLGRPRSGVSQQTGPLLQFLARLVAKVSFRYVTRRQDMALISENLEYELQCFSSISEGSPTPGIR